MAKLRHVTFRPLSPWMSLEDLLSMKMGERVKYVRRNLATARPNARDPYLSLDDFAEAVGARNRQRPIQWEKGGTPRDYAERIADLTPYPAEAFGAPGEAELVRELLGRRLQALEDRLDRERALRESAMQGVTERLADLEEALARAEPGSVPRTSAEEGP